MSLAGMPMRAQTDLMKRALDVLQLDSAMVGYHPKPSWDAVDRSDPFRLSVHDGLLAHPFDLPTHVTDLLFQYRTVLTADSANLPGYRWPQVRMLAALLVHSARNLGQDIGKVGFDYSPRVDSTEPLVAAWRNLCIAAGAQTGSTIVYPLPTQHWSDDESALRAAVKGMPRDFTLALAELVEACREAIGWRQNALRAIPRDRWDHIYRSTILERSQCDAHAFDQVVYDAALACDGASMSYGAVLLAQAVEKVLPRLAAFAGRSLTLDLPTPYGRIVVAGAEANLHAYSDAMILIDLGGNDRYLGPTAASSPSLPLSLVLDLAGDDSYECAARDLPAQGAGVLGYGMLVDLAGDDRYGTVTFGQGCGRFGVGVLDDREGDDQYRAEGFAQGAGMYGLGLLVDRQGGDRYDLVYYGQGYGFSRGLGLLADVRGDDRYTADDETLTHVGDETPEHNESNAQGFGSGRRGDHTDGHNMSGGIGILTDLDGNDQYSAGVFAQGSGYWFGTGILNDEKGDDRYRGVFFNLGAAAHFAIGALIDQRGNDQSELVRTLGFGAAHDGSAAIYFDLEGNDSYTMTRGDARSASLGAALNSSFALFLNRGGNDRYAPMGVSFGHAQSRRGGEYARLAPTVGLFFDLGGENTYPSGFEAKPGKEWQSVPRDPALGIHAYGIDVPSSSR